MTDNYIVIADIHGRYDLLVQLIQKISTSGMPLQGFKYVFTGDMVDRGPDSYKVVEVIKRLTEKGDAIALLGNHEDMMLNYYEKGIFNKQDIWLYNGGDKTVRSYGENMKLYGGGLFFKAFPLSGHYKWMKELPYYYETDKVWFSHAPVSKTQGLTGQYRANKQHLLWSYPSQVVGEGTNEHDHKKLAVCGHIHGLFDGILTPRVYPHIVYLDTGSGCAPHGRLSALIVEDGKVCDFIQAIPEEMTPEKEKEEKKFLDQLHDKGVQYDV